MINSVNPSANKASDVVMTAARPRRAFRSNFFTLATAAPHGHSPVHQGPAIGHGLKIQLTGNNFATAIEGGDLSHSFARHGVANHVIRAKRLERPPPGGPADISDGAMKIHSDRPQHANCGIGGNTMFWVIANGGVNVRLRDIKKNPVIRLVKILRAVHGVNRHSRTRRKHRCASDRLPDFYNCLHRVAGRKEVRHEVSPIGYS
jgi:hypothetical protein